MWENIKRGSYSDCEMFCTRFVSGQIYDDIYSHSHIKKRVQANPFRFLFFSPWLWEGWVLRFLESRSRSPRSDLRAACTFSLQFRPLSYFGAQMWAIEFRQSWEQPMQNQMISWPQHMHLFRTTYLRNPPFFSSGRWSFSSETRIGIWSSWTQMEIR